MSSVQNKLTALITPVVESLGCELWGLEYLTQGRQATLRVYIEKVATEKTDAEKAPVDGVAEAAGDAKKDSGIGLHDCEKVSRQISSVLDVEDPIASHYTLEVSSPGMDRPLFLLSHYESSVGEKVSVKLSRKFEERKNFTGVIVGVENDEVILRVDEEEYVLPVELIDKANIIPTF
jgi:ribosome maturation factor RimP